MTTETVHHPLVSAGVRSRSRGAGSNAEPSTPPMRWSFRLGSLAGIGVYVHATFFLLLAWLALGQVVRGSTRGQLVGSLLLTIAVFTAVVLHELGHALTARRFGIGTRDITLLPIGGVSRLERMPSKPSEELKVALAGPAVNVVIALVLFGVLTLTKGSIDAYAQRVVGAPFVAQLLWINVSLAVFNLLPAFPMDGGRVLRAALAFRMDPERATATAARVGRGMAVVLGVLGLFTNPVLVLIALFVWIGATQESAGARAKSILEGIVVGKAMVREVQTLPAHAPLRSAVDAALAGFQQDFPVVDDEMLVGVLTRTAMLKALADGGPEVAIEDAMQREFEIAAPDEMIDVAMTRLDASPCNALVVVEADRMVGMLTPENVGELLMVQTALRQNHRPRVGQPPPPA